jgi:P-type Ca2+ transporter type 2C
MLASTATPPRFVTPGPPTRIEPRCTTTPGRLRVAVQGLRGCPSMADLVVTRLEPLPGVRRVEPSPLTGNVLVTYVPTRWTHDRLLSRIAGALGAPEWAAPRPRRAGSPGAAPAPAPVEVRAAPAPGRVRLAVPGLRRVPERERPLEAALLAVRGVHFVQANAWTGNVLVLFDPSACSVDALVAACATAWRREVTSRNGRVQPSEGIRALPAPPPGEPSVDWHALPGHEVARRLHVDPRHGLAGHAADERLRQVGPNRMPEAHEPSLLNLLAGQLLNAPSGLLTAGAVVSLATGGLLEAGLIVLVLGANALVGAATERTGHRAIAALRRSPPIRVRVRRDGQERVMDAAEVVPGDLVQLWPGDPVPADARVLEAQRLVVEESALTGESHPVEKRVDEVPARAPLADRRSMVYRGTTVVGGRGQALVVTTGERTVLGTLHLLAAEAEAPPTPMERDLDRLGRGLAIGATAICAGVMGLGLLRGSPLLFAAEVAVSLGVAAIPEGLTALATTVLALASGRMRRKGTLIRTLGAAEALGSVTVVCADKTGTLTENRMAARELYAGGRVWRISGPALRRDGGLALDGEPVQAEVDPLVLRALRVGVLCSDAELESRSTGELVVDGSATEGALQVAALKAGLVPQEVRERYPRFDGRDRADLGRHMLTVHRIDGRLLALVKGSPEEVLGLCVTTAEADGSCVALDAECRTELLRANADMAGRARRVLALAERELPESYAPDELGRGYTFLGLIGLVDPIRPAVPAAIDALHGAGIRTVMITGDQALTATAVAHELGLARGSPLHVLEAGDLEALGPDALRGLVRDVHVFARVSPETKLAIVRALQANGEVVAMTGDGVNDGPALRAADVGVAMGQHGTELARELADVVLSTDDFSQMRDAVEEGRLVRANVQRVLHFLLATNASEVWVVAAAMAAGLPTPLTPLQLLWLNLVTDIAPGLGLAVEPREPGLMRQPPRDPREPILPKPLLRRMAWESGLIAASVLGVYSLGVLRAGRGPVAQTMAFGSLMGAQLLHVPLARAGAAPATASPRPRNRPLAVGVALAAALQLLALFVPPLRGVLGGARLGLTELGIVAAGALLPITAIELERRSRYQKAP